jgi:uncharacterized protein YbgA (DUF1722 family)
MELNELAKLFDRELKKLEEEINSYSIEERLWISDHKISNSAGNLCLHLFGNLRTFIGKELGKKEYLRDREREFAAKGIPRAELLEELVLVRQLVNETLTKLDPKKLNDKYPLEQFGHPMTNGYFLLHLYGHFHYHLGQINYHRRFLDLP